MRLIVAPLLALALLGSSGPPPATQAPPAVYRVISRDGARSLPFVVLNNQDYAALEEIAQLFGLTAREDRLVGSVTLTAGTRSIIVTTDQTVVSVAGRLVSLAAPPVRQGTRWMLPLDILPRAVALLLDTRIDLRRATRLLVVGDLRVPRVATRVDQAAAGATITFDVAPAVPARVTLDGGRLNVIFEADLLDLAVSSFPGGELLQAIQPGDSPTSVRVVPGPKFALHRAASSQPEPGSSRLVLTLLPAATEAPAPAPLPAPLDPAVPLPPAAPGLRTVVIDAGHGGAETGARGPQGIEEKAVTLAVARRLRTLIEGRLGLRVALTRDDDRLLTLDERSAYANSQKADILVSIHANAAPGPSLRGAEVYFLSLEGGVAPAPDESSGETLPALGGGLRSVDLIPWDTAQARYLERSATLAGIIEQSLRSRVEMSPRALQAAPFRVLVGANMPAALVEIGYLSNPDQERALASDTYQDQVAQALFDAVVQFRMLVERPASPRGGNPVPRAGSAGQP